jgi:4-amino-4-deoxy-L-arabinose transferase-like glycosyltransferase
MTRKISVNGLAALSLVAVALFMGFFNLAGYLMNDDEGAYLYGAWRVSLGDVPYRDFFISQTPLSFYLGGALFRAFGPSVLAARALCWVLVMTAAFLIFFATKNIFGFGPKIALLGAAVFLFTKHIYFLGRLFMPDCFAVFLGTVAVVFALKAEQEKSRREFLPVFLFGASTGLAALAKLNAALLLFGYAFFLIFLLMKKTRFMEIATKAIASATGFLASFGLVYGLMLLFVPGTFQATIGFHLAKEKAVGASFGQLALTRIVQFMGNHDYGLVPIAVIGMFFGRCFKERKRALLVSFFFSVMLQIFVPGVFYLRYVVLAFVPLALFLGDGVGAIFSWKKWRALAIPVFAALLLLCLGPSFSPKKLTGYDSDTRALASYIKIHSSPADYVFGDDPGINFHALRPCPPQLVDVSEATGRSGRITAADAIRECEAYHVKLIFVEKGHSALHLRNLRGFPDFESYLDKSYEFALTLPREFIQADIYLRKPGS